MADDVRPLFPEPKVEQEDPGRPAKDVRNAWYCPDDGTRLSYGVYCKTCKAEKTFAYRPPTELDQAREALRRLPPPEYPEFVRD